MRSNTKLLQQLHQYIGTTIHFSDEFVVPKLTFCADFPYTLCLNSSIQPSIFRSAQKKRQLSAENTLILAQNHNINLKKYDNSISCDTFWEEVTIDDNKYIHAYQRSLNCDMKTSIKCIATFSMQSTYLLSNFHDQKLIVWFLFFCISLFGSLCACDVLHV